MKTLIIFMSVLSILSMAISSSCLYLTWELGKWTVNYDEYCKLTYDTHEQQQSLMELQSALSEDVNDSVLRLDPLEHKVSDVEERLNHLEQNLGVAFEQLQFHEEKRLDVIDKHIAYLFENIPEKNK